MKTAPLLSQLRLFTGLSLLCTCLVLFGNACFAADTQSPQSPAKRPNILIWLMDDVGFGQPGVFGGPVETPTLDALASNGLRFNNFHSTALCSPSRAALLTGRNHHAVSLGNHAGFRSDDEGYTAKIPSSAGSMARILQMNGYATWALGKWDQLPMTEINPAGPYEHWPSGQGFDRFYGFLYADMDHFHPILWSDHTPVEPAKGRSDYFLTTDLADKAIELIHQQKGARPDQPFLLYWASGASHAPHHAPREYIDRYRGRFDAGWEKMRQETLARQKAQGLIPQDVSLPPWPANIPTWNSLNTDERRVASRSMEAMAGQLTHADHEFGRIIAELRRMGQLDNTIIIVTSDNGASAGGGMKGAFNEWRFSNGLQTSTEENLKHLEDWGGPATYPEYPAGWAVAGNTPFRYYKTQVHYGGVREPMIVSWPAGIQRRGEVRGQFHHLNDIMPTLLDLVGVEPPSVIDGVKQQPIDGVSMRYAFTQPATPTRHPTQYFELFGNRGIVANGWKAVVVHRKEPWQYNNNLSPFDKDVWELYNVERDFNEQENLATKNPAKLAQLQALFDQEAKRNHVYPLTPDFASYERTRIKTSLEARDYWFVYRSGEIRRLLGGGAAPPTGSMGTYNLDADVALPAGGGNGVIVADGGAAGGYALYLDRGRPVFCYNFLGTESTFIRAEKPLAAGKVHLRVEFRKMSTGGAKVTLLAGSDTIASGAIKQLVPRMYQGSDAFSVGLDEGSRVTSEYGEDNAFTGNIDQVIFDFAPK